MSKRANIKHTRNLRIISYLYLLLLVLDDNPLGPYFAVPWILYLLFDSYRVGFLTTKALLHCGLILFFLFSLLYDKSTSSLYHPLIGKEIVLSKNVYISRGFIDGKFNASDSNFSLRDQEMVLLPKGETVRVVSFIREGILNFNPDYDIEVDTPLNQQILDQLDPTGSTRGHANGQLHFWSNSFFYAIGILSNTKVDEYSRTSNALFKILYFLYPFAILYLLLQSFKTSMDKIQAKCHFHPLSILLYTVAYYYVLLASINDGFSGFLLGIPYLLFLLWEIWYLKNNRLIKYLHIAIILLAVFFIFSDRSKSQLLYPMVGKTYTVANDINYSYDNFYINKIKVFDNPYRSHLDKQKPMFLLKSGDRFHIESQMVTGHADMGTTYTFKIDSKSFSVLDDFISQNLAKIKATLRQDYTESFNKGKTDFYFENEKQFYISNHELWTLMESQGLPYNEHSIETRFTYMSFYLLVYPVILALFFLLMIFRNKEMFYGKHNKTVEPIKNPQADS